MYNTPAFFEGERILVREEEVTIIPGRLYWVCSSTFPCISQDIFTINTDAMYEYIGFNYDFGPLDISQILTFGSELHYTLRNPALKSKIIVVICGQTFNHKANSFLLICAYVLLYQNKSAEEVWSQLNKQIRETIVPFRDSLKQHYCSFQCTILDCLLGLSEALKLQWFTVNSFDHFKYDTMANMNLGNISEVVPSKLFAFRAPRNKRQEGVNVALPEDFLPVFSHLKIKKVIQLNEASYDKNIFEVGGVEHVKIIFPDCGTPSDSQVAQFLDEVDKTDGGVAVHCLAGLGRTGTMIAMYCMKKHYFPARPFIAFLRMVRPGSIHGPQHDFIQVKETEFLPIEPRKLSVKYNPFMTVETLFRHAVSDIDPIDDGNDSFVNDWHEEQESSSFILGQINEI